jgi:hypothetical protein
MEPPWLCGPCLDLLERMQALWNRTKWPSVMSCSAVLTCSEYYNVVPWPWSQWNMRSIRYRHDHIRRVAIHFRCRLFRPLLAEESWKFSSVVGQPTDLILCVSCTLLMWLKVDKGEKSDESGLSLPEAAFLCVFRARCVYQFLGPFRLKEGFRKSK